MSQKNLRLSDILSPAYYPAWRSDTQNLVIGGSKGSGKSYFAAFYIIYNMLKNPNLNVLVVRRVFGTMRDSCYTDLLKIINKYMIPGEWTHTFNPLEIKYNKTGQKVLFRGLDDPYKMASITVENGYLAWVWFEEAFDITDYNDILKIQGSIRAIPPSSGLKKKFIYTFNPWSPDHWLKEEYFDKKREDTLAMITTYLDNPGINDEDREWYEQLKEINPRAAEVICYGRWGRAEGLIYDNWLEKEFDPQEILQREGTKAIYGLDFGYMTSYNAFMAAVLDTNKHELWVFDEIYSKGMTNLDIAKMITQAGYGKEKIIADSAEPKSIETLKTGRGLVEEIVNPDTGDVRYEKYSLPGIMPAFKGPDSVRNGIARMQEFTIYIHPRCKNFKAEIQLYAYKVDKNGKLTGEPEKEYDHACLVGSTLITTRNGQVPIKDITVGTEVLTRSGWRRVTDWALTKEDAEVWYVGTDNSKFLKATPDHRLITRDGKRMIKDLYLGDRLITWVNDRFEESGVQEIIQLQKHEDVYNITVESDHEYFANGILSSNCDALRYAVTAAYASGHTKVAEAKGTPDMRSGTLFEIKEEKATPKKGHTRVVSTYSDPNEDWRSYYGGSYL